MADFYKDIEARITAAMQEYANADMQAQTARMHTARRQGKSALLAHMYGIGGAQGFSDAAKMFTSQREHPLQYKSQFRFVERAKEWGNVPVYKVATKVTSEIICRKQKVPHTNVHYGELMEAASDLPDVVGLVWTRATKKEQIETAVATMLMLNKEVAVLRAFEP